MELKPLTSQELEQIYQTDLKSSFPPDELKPLSFLKEMIRKGTYLPLGLYGEKEEYLGCCLVWLGRPGVAMIDYLCVSPGKRNGGCGAFMLAHMREHCKQVDLVIIEAEAPSELDVRENTLVNRRVHFYERNGFVRQPFFTRVFGVKYTILINHDAKEDWDVAEECAFIYRSSFPEEFYAQNMEIPCT